GRPPHRQVPAHQRLPRRGGGRADADRHPRGPQRGHDPRGRQGPRPPDHAHPAHARPRRPHRLARRAQGRAARRRHPLRAARVPADRPGLHARAGREGQGQQRQLAEGQDAPRPADRAGRPHRLARGGRLAGPHARPPRLPRRARPDALLRRRVPLRRRPPDRLEPADAALPAARLRHDRPGRRPRQRPSSRRPLALSGVPGPRRGYRVPGGRARAGERERM
ncbi:MAG: Uncharacterized protein YobT, partial [uncultured Solirubrobacteraceae bacterium]